MSLPRPNLPSRPDSFDRRDFRDAMGRFVTGVTVVTTRTADGAPIGVTVNSFTSVSLDPPLVLFCLEWRSRSLEAVKAAGCFAVHVLAADQRELSVRFAGNGRGWDTIASTSWDTGAPILQGCLAALECTLETIHEGGDHAILVGRVLRLTSRPDGTPLAFHGGRYEAIDPAD